MKPSTVIELEEALTDLRQGVPGAMDRLLDHAYLRLQRMASRMMGAYPCVARWDDTDDVWQSAAIRFQRALAKTTPESVVHFFHLAGTQIRRTLIDLARRYQGPHGLCSNYETHGGDSTPVDLTNDPLTLADWTEFHERVEKLPPDLKEVFDLFWYGDIGVSEIAERLGIGERTVKRRWREARLTLAEMGADCVPS